MATLIERLEHFAEDGMGDISRVCEEARDQIVSLRETLKPFAEATCGSTVHIYPHHLETARRVYFDMDEQSDKAT